MKTTRRSVYHDDHGVYDRGVVWGVNSIFLALVLVLVASTSVNAVTLFSANLTNSQENPPTNPTTTTGVPRTSFGTAAFVLNDLQTALTFTATVTGLDFTGSQSPDTNDNLVAAHIHAGPNLPGGPNNPVVWGFFGSPFNDNNPNDVALTLFATGVGGTISGKWDAPEGNNTTLAAQLPNIFAGRAYINFHTSQFPGGEIRGQLVMLPEPGTILLLASGLLGIAASRLLRKAV